MENINNLFLVSSIILSVALVINFIYMIVKYQKDRMLPIINIGEKELLDKHGSIICSCILQKRGLMPRDIIATLVELIEKDEISISLNKTSENGKIINVYRLNKIGNGKELSDIESSVIKILFNDSNECTLNSEISMIKRRLETKSLIKMIDKKLEDIGANSVKVPSNIKVMNNIYFIFVCIFFIIHLIATFNSVTFFRDFKQNIMNWIIIVIKIDALVILGTMLIRMLFLVVERIKNNKFKHKIDITDKILLNIFSKFLIANCIVLILLMFAGNNMVFVFDILLMDIAMVIMVSDETFSSHSTKIIKDYISLKNFEEKLETKEILEHFHIDKIDTLKSYISFLIACNLKEANMVEFVQKVVEVSSDKAEKEKYNNILHLISFNEDNINNYFFSKDFTK